VDLGPSITSTLVVVALGVAVLALAIAVGAHLRLSGIQARYRILWAGGEKDVAAVLSEQSGKITHLHGDVERVCAQLSRTAGDVEQSLRHVAVVRYDAFGDMGGRLSFSAASSTTVEMAWSSARSRRAVSPVRMPRASSRATARSR